MKKRKVIIGVILIVLILIFIIGFIVLNKTFNNSIDDNSINDTTQEENVKYNNNAGVIDDKIVNNVSFTNIECSFDGVYSILEYTITNHNKQSIQLGEYEIVVKDKDGNILANIAPTLDYELAPEESYNTGNAIDIDLTDVDLIELVLQ